MHIKNVCHNILWQTFFLDRIHASILIGKKLKEMIVLLILFKLHDCNACTASIGVLIGHAQHVAISSQMVSD